MGDLIRGENFAAGEVVTAARLHKLVEDAEIKKDAVTANEIADGSVTQVKLALDVAVTAGQVTLPKDNILVGDTAGKGKATPLDLTTMGLEKPEGTPLFGVKADGITSLELANDAVTTGAIQDKNVTFPKIQDIQTQRLLGRSTAAAGVVEEITIGQGLQLSSGSLSVTGGATVIKVPLAEQAVPSSPGQQLVFPHGQATAPAIFRLYLINRGTDAGYVDNDRIPLELVFGQDWIRNYFYDADATRVHVVAYGQGGLFVLHKNTGAPTPITYVPGTGYPSWRIGGTAWF